MFIKAVRELWALPQPYVDRLEAQERAQKEQGTMDVEKAAKVAQMRRERALQDSEEEEMAHLDATYERLDARNRKRVDDEAVNRLGILGRMGKAQGALAAMRRQVLKDLMSR